MHHLLTFLVLSLSLHPITSLKIASNLETIEYTPELIASQDFLSPSTSTNTLTSGGVANLPTDTSLDLAANAETQALRQFAKHKNIRIIFTVCEVYYRIVASKKAGISSVKDLKGKRIGSFPGTSAGYFVEKYLRSEGLEVGSYTAVSGNTCNKEPCGSGTFPYMLKQGTVDAVGMWEPSVELAIRALGTDALVLQNRTIYREIFNLHSTTQKLSDPTTRKSIISFLRSLILAEKVFIETPEKIWPRVSKAVGVDVGVLKNVWGVHSWNGSVTGGLPKDLLEVLVAEDVYVAKQDNRKAMGASELATLIDESVLKEAMEGM